MLAVWPGYQKRSLSFQCLVSCECLVKDCDCDEFEASSNAEDDSRYNCNYCGCPPAKHKRCNPPGAARSWVAILLLLRHLKISHLLPCWVCILPLRRSRSGYIRSTDMCQMPERKYAYLEMNYCQSFMTVSKQGPVVIFQK